jgi:hypothetical protein
VWSRQRAALRDIPGFLEGDWLSVEYDVKGSIPKEDRNTFLKVRVSTDYRGRVRVESRGSLDDDPNRIPTGWIVRGRTVRDVLPGEWFATQQHIAAEPLSFELDEFRRRCLLEGMDEIALALKHEEKIAAYERAHGVD